MFEASAKKKVMSLSLEERENLARELLASVEAEKGSSESKEESVATAKEQTTQNDEKVVDEQKTETVDGKGKEETVQSKETVDEQQTAETAAAPEQPEIGAVQTSEKAGNGISIEDIVTRADLAAAIAALDAKFKAVVKENEDLKDQITGYQYKYEKKDFGTTTRPGVMPKDPSANDKVTSYQKSFEEYSKDFR